jgi:hypothetical protein
VLGPREEKSGLTMSKKKNVFFTYASCDAASNVYGGDDDGGVGDDGDGERTPTNGDKEQKESILWFSFRQICDVCIAHHIIGSNYYIFQQIQAFLNCRATGCSCLYIHI